MTTRLRTLYLEVRIEESTSLLGLDYANAEVTITGEDRVPVVPTFGIAPRPNRTEVAEAVGRYVSGVLATT